MVARDSAPTSATNSGVRRSTRPLRRGRLIALIALAVTAGFALSGCSIDQDAFASAGRKGITEQAHRMYDLWIGSAIAALAVGVIVWGLIFWCIIRYRKRGPTTSCRCRRGTTCRSSSSTRSIPFLIIAVLFYYTAVVETNVDKISQEPGRDRRRHRVQVELAVHYEGSHERRPDGPAGHHDRRQRLHPGAGRADRRDRSGSSSTRRTSSTRSGCRSCCSSATCSRATWSTSSRSRSTRRARTSAAAPSCAARTTRR